MKCCGANFLRSANTSILGKGRGKGRKEKRKTFFHPRRRIQRACATRFSRCEASIYRRRRPRRAGGATGARMSELFQLRTARQKLYLVLADKSTSDGRCVRSAIRLFGAASTALRASISGRVADASWLMVSVDGAHMRLTSCRQGDRVRTSISRRRLVRQSSIEGNDGPLCMRKAPGFEQKHIERVVTQ